MPQATTGAVPLRKFGRYEIRISALGFGGHHLGEAANERTAIRIVQEAVDGGITFFDNCWEYRRRKTELWMGAGLKGRRDKVYAMSLPVAATISGVDTMEVLDQNLAVAVDFRPFTSAEMQQLRERSRPFAEDARFELFKITTQYDGKVGREQHHFSPVEHLPL